MARSWECSNGHVHHNRAQMTRYGDQWRCTICFPPEAFSYDGPITSDAVSRIQREADKKMAGRSWTVIERIEDLP